MPGAGRPTFIRLAAAARSGPSGSRPAGLGWLAWAGVLGGLLLVVAAAVTAPVVAAAPAAGDSVYVTGDAGNTITPARVGDT